MKLRDRDAIITKEGLILRVFGYSHPSYAYVCDIEYAPSNLFQSANPKAPRGKRRRYFKFYEEEGWKFLQSKFPNYLLDHAMLQTQVIGVRFEDIASFRRPERVLYELLKRPSPDELITAMRNSLKFVVQESGISVEDFGVFGSMLHGFHHPKLSDIDLLVSGVENIVKLRSTLARAYSQRDSPFNNEFETDAVVRGKNWRFKNLSTEEYVWHQQRKSIYAIYNDEPSGRLIKTEFEPIKDWKEIRNEYDREIKIAQHGWVKMIIEVTDDTQGFFMPSVYKIRPIKTIVGPDFAASTTRIISYLEEFRMQVWNKELAYVEGNLEEVRSSNESFYQIALTYCPKYYEQVLKCA